MVPVAPRHGTLAPNIRLPLDVILEYRGLQILGQSPAPSRPSVPAKQVAVPAKQVVRRDVKVNACQIRVCLVRPYRVRPRRIFACKGIA